MDVGKSFTYVFEDKDWLVKLLIGALVSLIPIVNLAATGYLLRVIRNVAEGREQPLPDWSELGDHFVKGLLSCLGGLIYGLPLIVVIMMMMVVIHATEAQDIEALRVMGNLCIMSFACFSGLYGLALALFMPAALTFYAVQGEFGAFFRLGAIWRLITANLGNYILALAMWFVAGVIASFGILLCFVGVYLTNFWAGLVGAHLMGQVYRLSGPPA